MVVFPAVGYLMQIMGVSKQSDVEITLTDKLPADILDSHIAYFARLHSWSLLHKESSQEKTIYIFQVGKWGIVPRGVQEVNLTLFFEEDRHKVFLKSRSLMGQFLDFGVNQKNIDDMSLYLADLSHDPNGTLKRVKSDFPAKSAVIDNRYWYVALAITIIWLIWTMATWFIPKNYVPGRVRVVFQQRVPDEVSDEILQANGAIRCTHELIDEFPTYECDVPVGDEPRVADRISRNSAVRSASAILEN